MSSREHLAAGSAAMAKGEWSTARDEFGSAWSETESAQAFDGVGRALWWFDDPVGSLELRASAFAHFRRAGREADAAAVSIWLARQYRSAEPSRRLPGHGGMVSPGLDDVNDAMAAAAVDLRSKHPSARTTATRSRSGHRHGESRRERR